jgi:hypothetical protein
VRACQYQYSLPQTPKSRVLLSSLVEKGGTNTAILESTCTPTTQPHALTHTNTCITNSIEIQEFGDIQQLHSDILLGNGLIVSDGSYKEGRAAGGWIITSHTCYPSHKIECSIISPGQSIDQDSHRAEAIAILGAVSTVNTIFNKIGYIKGTITIACDNMSALHYTFSTTRYPTITTKMPDFDILSATRSILWPTIVYKWHHVQGHQDTHPPKSNELDIWAKLNIEADRIAKARVHLLKHNITTYSLPNETWTISLDGYKVCKNLEETVYEFISATTMRSFWHKKRGFTDGTFDSVDWSAIHEASQHITKSRQHWLAKHTCGVCGVNSMLFKWKQRENEDCPRCSLPETAKHVWICDSEDTRRIWKATLQELTKWLISVDTDNDLIKVITANLLPWADRQQPRTHLEKLQDTIGWDIFLEGTLPVEWALCQQQFFTSTGSTNSGKRWLVQLILKLWNIAWDLWEHRNNIAHAANEAALTENLTNEINRIRVLDECPPEASYLFTDGMTEQLVSANPSTKKSWLANFHAHVKFSKKSHTQTRGLHQMQQTMRTFLQPIQE